MPISAYPRYLRLRPDQEPEDIVRSRLKYHVTDFLSKQVLNTQFTHGYSNCALY